MKDKSITRKITQGMYILTTKDGGCCVDAVSQVSTGDNPLISVSVKKTNYTNELMKKNNSFALSIIGMDSNPEIIKTYGFNSMRNYDKFANSDTIKIDELNVISSSLGYMICEKIEQIDNDTHTVFIGKLIKADKFNASEPMTYQYYQENKEKLLQIQTNEGKKAWICTVCGYIYESKFIPKDFTCPICGVGQEYFKLNQD